MAHGAGEGLDEFGIELGAGTALEFGERLIGGAAFFVAAVAGDGVVGISNGDNASAERNIVAGEGFGVAGAVEKEWCRREVENAREPQRADELDALIHRGVGRHARGMTWREFSRARRRSMFTVDFFTVETI